MRTSGAPEGRGTKQTARRGLAESLASAVFLLSAFASPALAADREVNPATAAAATSEHQLQPVPHEARPAFVLPDLEGVRQDLTSRRADVVLVHFFATWCVPCREELSSLSRLAAARTGERLSIVAVNVAEVPLRVRRFVEEVNVRFPVLLDADRAVTKAWGVSILPTTFVLDRNLIARFYVEGDIDWLRADVAAALDRVAESYPKRND